MTNEHDAPLTNGHQQTATQPVVMSSRIRLARNLENYVHPLMFPNEDEGHRVVNEVQDALTDLKVQRLSDMDQQSAYKLVAKHLISPDLTKQPAAAVLLNDDETVSVMVNEEDHVRIQVMGQDLSLDALYQRASEIDDQLDAEVDISYDETLGYLTTCPTNIGTGMRASVMLHLPGLSIMKRMNRIAQSINRFGFTIRGIYGEGSQVYGHVYQVSNQLTLGKSEHEIIEALTELVTQIIHEELEVRQRLLAHKENETLDRIYRSLGILKYSRRISVDEASYRLSDIKLGIDLGVLDMPAFDFNAMMIAIQSPFLIDEESAQSIEAKRADILRHYL
ncbi:MULTISPECIES: protein arginine kinase [unclassified Staphylococcus]|uniref:protein arginine kinase n=1 Tax=unclassified Staphylococcus TaxID=91994 RepID=UPI0021CFC8E2|nr:MULTISPECIES: protein arginine kinase [unclassified Staphylococcus]UXR78546.1 protein arginine kinase [Staphylococcus sp. IVB6227]UXR82703.1 protein arginine kinase [Staphylococcus sp. IVB6214]